MFSVTAFSTLLGIVGVSTAVLLSGRTVVAEDFGSRQRDSGRAVPRDRRLPDDDARCRRRLSSRLTSLSMTDQFLVKDVALLGVGAWTLTDALHAARVTRPDLVPTNRCVRDRRARARGWGRGRRRA